MSDTTECFHGQISKTEIPTTEELESFIANDFADVVTNNDLTQIDERPETFTHRIDILPGSTPPARPPYRLPHYQIEEMKKQIQSLLDAGFIDES